MVTTPPLDRPRDRRGLTARIVVHLALMAAVLASLILEPVLALHVLFGFCFAGLVIAHVLQRRRTSRRLAATLTAPWRLGQPASRLALSDAVLLALTMAMFASGLWDWIVGRATGIEWHPITGVLLAGYLVLHTVRRRRRIVSSRIR